MLDLNRYFFKMKKSPFNLLQEIYWPDEWKILACCILLNQTTRTQVDQVRDRLFEKYPGPKEMAEADEQELSLMIKSLGFQNKRAKTLKKFSEAYLKQWESVSDLPGIGPYAFDSWMIFINDTHVPNPLDHVLKSYVDWKVTQ